MQKLLKQFEKKEPEIVFEWKDAETEAEGARQRRRRQAAGLAFEVPPVAGAGQSGGQHQVDALRRTRQQSAARVCRHPEPGTDRSGEIRGRSWTRGAARFRLADRQACRHLRSAGRHDECDSRPRIDAAEVPGIVRVAGPPRSGLPQGRPAAEGRVTAS